MMRESWSADRRCGCCEGIALRLADARVLRDAQAPVQYPFVVVA